MNFETWFSNKFPDISNRSIGAVLRLANEGATVPFMARYRKDQTGNLDEVAIRAILDEKEMWDRVTKRRHYILSEIEAQGKLAPDLREKITQCFDEDLLEDLYLPYKKKKKTKAEIARDGGLLPLADWIWNCAHGTETPLPGQTLEIWSYTFRNAEKGFSEVPEVLRGVEDILTERLSETFELRMKVRELFFERAVLHTVKGEKAEGDSKFSPYFEFSEKVVSLLKGEYSHRYLAIRRGVKEKELKLSWSIEGEPNWFESLLATYQSFAVTVPGSPGENVLKQASQRALSDSVLPSIQTELLKALKEVADRTAVEVFAANLRKILLAPPFGPQWVLGVDPGIKTGAKVVVIDDSGKFVENTVWLLQCEAEKKKAEENVKTCFEKYPFAAVAVGNGTGGRETEVFVRHALKSVGKNVPVVAVNESGASIYSASETAREEFPALDVTVRGAISIARRLQDPLAELVKIEPEHIGVGQYQHDVAPTTLKKNLEFVVDSVVNSVGVNLNTASYHLLAHVSGIGPVSAKAIVQHRMEKGLFKRREDLKNVPEVNAKVFEQAAGFLRIPDGESVLENTGIHPEQYAALEDYCARVGKQMAEIVGEGARVLWKDAALKEKIGELGLDDTVIELEKPGRAVRKRFNPCRFREDIFEMTDVKAGMICPGVVTNVTNFGAFVDIGVHQDGLVHISQLSENFVRDPQEVVSPGDSVSVKVLEVNLEKKQLSLSMKQAFDRPTPPPKPKRPPRPKFEHNPFAALSKLKK